MKLVCALLAGFLVLGLAAYAQAAKGNKNRDLIKPLVGTVVKIDGTNIKVTKKATKGAVAEDVTVATDANTAISVDGKAGAKLSDIQPGMNVRVTPATGTAQKVAATAPKAAKAGKGKTGK